MKIATATATAQVAAAVAAAAGKITGSFSFENGAQWLADRRMLAVNLRPTKRVEETLQQRYYLQTTRQAGVVIAPARLLTNGRASIITEPLAPCLWIGAKSQDEAIEPFGIHTRHPKFQTAILTTVAANRLLHNCFLSLSFELLRTLPIGQMTSSSSSSFFPPGPPPYLSIYPFFLP